MKKVTRNAIEVCIWMAIFAICVVAGECVRLVYGLEVPNISYGFGPMRIDADVEFVLEYATYIMGCMYLTIKAGNAIWYRKKKD